MTTNQPTIEERLSRLENFFVSVGETVERHEGNIDVLVANIQQLTENVAATNQRVDELAINIQQLTENVAATNARVDTLAEQAAQDRQQTAIDRQEFRNSINQILNYLRDRNGGSPPPQQ